MPITLAPPRELLRVIYTVTGTSTSTATDGAALSTPWGGSFDIAARSSVEIEVECPYIYASIADAAIMHLLVDGVSLGNRRVFCYVANVGGPVHGIFEATGLSAGSHTVAVQGSIGAAGTMTVLTGAALKGVLTVREQG